MSDDFECPECGNEFDTKRGLHIHIGQSHSDKKEEILSEMKEAEEVEDDHAEDEKKSEAAAEKSSEEDKSEETKKEKEESGLSAGTWIGIGVMVLLLALSGFYFVVGDMDIGLLTEDPADAPDAVMEAFSFLEEMPELQMAELELLGYEDTDSGVYLFTVLLSADAPQMDPYGEMEEVEDLEEEMDFFVSKDGDMFFIEGEETNLDDPSVEEIGEEGAKALTELIGLGQMPEEDLEVSFNQVLDTIDGNLYRLEMMLSGEFEGEIVEQVMESYATTDGKYFFAEGMNITETRLFMEEMEQQMAAMEDDDAMVEDAETETETESPTGQFIAEDTSEAELEQLIECFSDSDLLIYGAEWCPACGNLADSLGGYETVDPIWVECTEEGERCDTEKQTTAVPEVQLDGEVIDARNPEALAQETGCELP